MVKITGKAMMSTIKIMETLGSVGKGILKDNKALKIKPEKTYPTSMRSGVYDALLSRYGQPAIRALGFIMAEMWEKNSPELIIRKVKTEFASGKRFSRKDPTVRLFNDPTMQVSLEKFCQYIMETWDVAIKTLGSTNDPSYRAFSLKKSKFIYEFHLKQAGVFARHIDFNLANLDRQLTYFIAKEWDFLITPDYEKIFDDKYGCLFVFKIKFFKRKKQINVTEYYSEKRSVVMDQFLKSVLEVSEKQRNMAEVKSAEAINQKRQIEKISSQLSKYLPPQIHDALFSGELDSRINTKRKKLTIFFSDIKNFTATSEGMQPEDLTNYLNEYFSEMTTIALFYGATIDKYIGDAMMVFFGDPETNGEREDARNCVKMALAMQDRMGKLREKWKNEGFADPFQVRIGLNTGYCNVGNFGSDQRLTYTIIGGEVNVAQRLEANADANGILMSYETYAHVQDLVNVEERDSIKMKGINREIKIYSVSSIKKSINKSLIDRRTKEAGDQEISTEEVAFLSGLPSRILKIEKNLLTMSELLERLINDKEDGK